MYHTLYDKQNMLFRLALFIVYMLYIILSYRFVFIFLCAYGMVYFQYGEFSCKNSKILFIVYMLYIILSYIPHLL